MILEDVLIVDPIDGQYVGTIEYDDVIRIIRRSDTVSPNEEDILFPAFVDPHIHGIKGIDTMYASEQEFLEFKEYEALEGVWYFLPTTVTSPLERLAQVRLPDQMKDHKLHVEGPFISEKRKGAHNGRFVTAPSERLFDYTDPNRIGLITMAPEWEGFEEFADTCSKKGIKVSIGHSDATFEQARWAYRKGYMRLTHFPNAMSPLHHRAMGLVGAGLYFDFTLELICDGLHVAPEFVELIYRVKGADRIILMTDSISATGLSDGKYLLGDLDVTVKDGTATLSDGTIAGSLLTFSQALRNFQRFTRCSLIELAKVSSYNACLDLGIMGGRIFEGYPAKFVLLDKNLGLKKTIGF
ncbi:MAG TPA: N-acetylglucosamine-6-phosphate deacetylase [Fervidobacterium sp.]|nr:N-acetylglucosamine-6-phosphate deacetylase [Fervidobacterium sp.]HOK88071.1 N-acetylglucosamine-6-phosphate deacetylase [Fervidobacterium sp.]HOM74460.1 N-acetylglucosamine-6-phosphate deacetylase [Fervidobacterium sp.]HOQ40099.1 N-acetylglucosamine-6-phosphate deacetylase [Fervidobacterium sp.]HPT54525.1 N-acetylglucosamine-6-phosphate deacetylase [Fervidobacterium sp.]